MDDPAKSDLIAQFCGITGTDAPKAQHSLEACDWDLQRASDLYFAQAAENAQDNEASDDEPQPSSSTQAPQSTPSTSSSQKPPQQKSKFGSLRDIQQREEANDPDEDSEKEQEYFAGGDKSGLAVQDPSQGGDENARAQMNRLIRQAQRQQQAHAPHPPSSSSRTTNFRGSGQTLGGDDVPSETIPDPEASRPRTPPTVERILHLWRNGFSVDDGPLFRNDDPANQSTLRLINQGQAPLSIMDVEPGQQVDVKLDPRMQEDYVQPKQKYKPFGSGGRRLGSPLPGDGSAAASSPLPTSATQPQQQPSQHSQASSQPQRPHIDESAPTVTLQIRLADGTRLPARFNTSQTIGDVYEFVNAANPASAGRGYALATTFPTKELSEMGAVIGEMKELGKGGVVVQKWT